MARGTLATDDPAYNHVMECSPCYEELMTLIEQVQSPALWPPLACSGCCTRCRRQMQAADGVTALYSKSVTLCRATP